MEILKTDILVIGGGGAGMRAALAARETGAEVLLVAKTPIGKSTCTYLSGGAFAVAAEGFTKEKHQKNTLLAGKGINARELVDILVEEAPDQIRELAERGLPGKWLKGWFFISGKRSAGGAPMTDLLGTMVENQGIATLSWVVAHDLVFADGKIIGALGFNFREGKPLGIQSKAVILANGGGGALFARNDNPVRITGDGYALAYDAGCRLRDMEFVQFIPSGLAEPGKPAMLIAPALCDYGRVTNSAGEDILKKYAITEKPVAVRSRDSFSLAIFREEEEGREVFLDLRPLSEEDWKRDSFSCSQREFLTNNLLCSEKPLRISPMCHFFMGGVAADEDGATGIPGLFAAGEVVGGLHGANRMGGNALGEILVFGHRAGVAAGRWAQKHEQAPDAENVLKQKMEIGEAGLKRASGPVSPGHMKKVIGKILWEQAGILREQRGLLRVLDSFAEIRENCLAEMKRETPKEVLEGIEVENALLVGEMIIRSALFREESRGAHFRRDFPQTNDQKWKGNIFLKKKNSEMHLQFVPLP